MKEQYQTRADGYLTIRGDGKGKGGVQKRNRTDGIERRWTVRVPLSKKSAIHTVNLRWRF
jgi:hypothetical protein